MEFPPDFCDLLRLFNEKKVEYLMVGGYAFAVHAHPRYTGDKDLADVEALREKGEM